MAKECEAKLKVDELESLRERLRDLGAVDAGNHPERNLVLDDATGSLRGRGMLLRVRTTGGPEAILTVKLPVEGGEFKIREEIETSVASSEILLRQLLALGYQVVWIYEKRRHSWHWRDCVLALDECPEIGCFVEIEGAPDNIRTVAAELGLDPAAHIRDNYLGLWEKHLRLSGQPPRHMVFLQEGKK